MESTDQLQKFNEIEFLDRRHNNVKTKLLK